MNILTALYTMRRGGAYDRFRLMLEALLERGCKVHCLSLTPIRVNHEDYHNHVLRIPTWLQESVIAKMVVLFVFPLYMLWIGRQEKIDLFIAFGTLYAFIESIPKLIMKKPMVTFLRGSFTYGMQIQGQWRGLLWLNRWIEKVGIYFSDTILSVNSTIQEEMGRATGRRKWQRWEVLPNNIPPVPIPQKQNILQIRQKYGVPEDAKVLVTAGVINRGKNIELLIRCLPGIGLRNLFLVIVGEPATEGDFIYQAFLEKLVKDLELGNRVVFTGWLKKEELWKIFQGVDLFILPSKNEGMPNVMLEALGCNLPCLGSNIAGIKDILDYDELLFDPLDANMLANKLRRVFGDTQYYNRLETLSHGRKSVFVFDWNGKVFEMVTGAI
jgi:glycosyltransferase involved in cell wall biosynthesis